MTNILAARVKAKLFLGLLELFSFSLTSQRCTFLSRVQLWNVLPPIYCGEASKKQNSSSYLSRNWVFEVHTVTERVKERERERDREKEEEESISHQKLLGTISHHKKRVKTRGGIS